MENDRLEGYEEGQKETEKSGPEEMRERLKRIKADLLARIAAKWANKENEPVIRSDFMLRVRPANTAVSSSDIFPFGSVEFCFEQDAEKMLNSLERQFPGRFLVMEFLLFPYEHGGKNLRPDAVFKPVNGGVVAKKFAEQKVPVHEEITATVVRTAPVEDETKREITKKRKKVRNRIVEAGAPLPVADAVAPDVTTDAATVVEDDAAAAPKVEGHLLPSRKERKNTLEQLKELIREAAASRSATENPDNDFANTPIDYDFAKWNLYAKSQVLRRIKRAFEANGINTPRDLVARLGTDSPTKKEWKDFIRTIDAPIAPNWLGESGSRDLLFWMRRNKLIQSDFRSG